MLYTVSPTFDVGTVRRRKCIIPRKYLSVLTHEVDVGTVIDTHGYRGFGLYIYGDDQKFHLVPTGDYYPIWPLKYLKLKGYLYYLSLFPDFDKLEFNNNISFDSYAKEFVMSSYDQNEFPPSDEPLTFRHTADANEMLYSEDEFTVQISDSEYLWFHTDEKGRHLTIKDNNSNKFCIL